MMYRGIRLGWLSADKAAERMSTAVNRQSFLRERLHTPLGRCWTPDRDVAEAFARGQRPGPYARRFRPLLRRQVVTGLVMELPEAAVPEDQLRVARTRGEQHSIENSQRYGYGFGDEKEWHFEHDVFAWPLSSATLHIEGPSGHESHDALDLLPPEVDDLPRTREHNQSRDPSADGFDARCRACGHQTGFSAFRSEHGLRCPKCEAVEGIEWGAGWPWGDHFRKSWYKPTDLEAEGVS